MESRACDAIRCDAVRCDGKALQKLNYISLAWMLFQPLSSKAALHSTCAAALSGAKHCNFSFCEEVRGMVTQQSLTNKKQGLPFLETRCFQHCNFSFQEPPTSPYAPPIRTKPFHFYIVVGKWGGLMFEVSEPIVEHCNFSF